MAIDVLFRFDASEKTDGFDNFATDGLRVSICSENDDERFSALLPRAEVIWHVLKPIDAATIARAPQLRLIQKIGIGVNTIDLYAAKERGISVCNMPGTNSRAVAEMALLLMLATLRRITVFDRLTRAGKGWDSPPQLDALGELGGRTVGLIGMGAVPQILSSVLQAMGANVVYTARTARAASFGRHVSMSDLLSLSDIVSVHLPLTPETKDLIGKSELDQMKKGAILINTARGGLVDEAEMIKALSDGRLAAAGLDVFAAEPVEPANALLTMDNIVVAPHIAWLTRETLRRSLAVARDNCLRLRDGRPLLHQVA